MENKLRIIYNILFKNIEYARHYTSLNIQEETFTPLVLFGRTVVTKEESENIPEDIIFKQACSEILKSQYILNSVEKNKFEHQNSDDFLNNRNRVVYEVKLTVIPNNKSLY